MAYHCYFNTNCPGCARSYLRFAPGERCPVCGSDESPVCDVVTELVHYARLTLVAQGDLELGAFQPLNEADAYVVRGYEVLEAARQHPELSPETIAAEAAAHYPCAWDEARRAHWERFFRALLARWAADRHRPLETPTSAERPAASSSSPTGASSAAGARSFLKKWQPKE